MTSGADISSEAQKEVARLREMIATTKILLPHGNVNFFFYEVVIEEAERAIREQDAVALCRILPDIRGME